MTYKPAEVFPGAWIECKLDEDKGIDKSKARHSTDPVPDDSNSGSDADGSDWASIASHASESPPEAPVGTAVKVDEASTKPLAHPDGKIVEKKKHIMSEPKPAGNAMDVDVDPPDPAKAKPDLDLLHSVKGMFRFLDLISESGSGGLGELLGVRCLFLLTSSPLVDKIIIAQESLKELINVLSPGAYVSLTKVDFKALDKLTIKPLGLYGSKSEIVAFLFSRRVVDQETARALNQPKDNASAAYLRSGLYVLRALDAKPVGPEQVFVIYWPEETTWNDDAISSVRRNRVTFMRYLTKISDQVTCLISLKHARSIVWNDEADDAPMDIDEESDRLFTFEVAKTNEQEEDVSVHPGFTMSAPILFVEKLHVECTLDASELQPTLVHGETSQAILTKSFVPGKFVDRVVRGETHTSVKLRNLMESGSIRLSPALTDEGIETLAEHGLRSRYPTPFEAWKSRNKEATESIEASGKEEEQETCRKVNEESPQLRPALREVVVDQLLNLFPTVQRTVLSSSNEEETQLLRTQYASLVSVHVKLQEELEKTISADNSDVTRLSPKFKTLKEQILCISLQLSETRSTRVLTRKWIDPARAARSPAPYKSTIK